MLVANAKDHQGGQTLGVSDNALGINPLARQFFADKAAHMLVADPRDQTRLQAKPRRACRHIRRRTADVFLERRHVLQPTAHLRAVKIDRGSADGDHIKGFHAASEHLQMRGTDSARLHLEYLFHFGASGKCFLCRTATRRTDSNRQGNCQRDGGRQRAEGTKINLWHAEDCRG